MIIIDTFNNILFWIAILVILITIYLTLIEPYWFKVKNLQLEFEDLPEEFDGFTITHLSDIHTRKNGLLEKKLVKLFNNLPESDICLLTGDLVFDEKAIPIFLETIKHIKTKEGYYFISGNSEYKSYNNHLRLISTLSKIGGLKNLDNKNTKIFRGNIPIELIGLDDVELKKADQTAAFKGTSKNNFKIVLIHCPSLTRAIVPYSPNLVLAGHTHGGQVRLPFINVVYTNITYPEVTSDKALNDGLFTHEKLSKILKKEINKTTLLVSRGLGTSKLWIRFRCRPELHIITLKRK